MLINSLKSFHLAITTFCLFISVAYTGCSKSDDTPAIQRRSKEYKMYNTSSGNTVEAGSFSIAELQDGNARVSVRLNAGYRVAGVLYKSNITTTDASNSVELVFAVLADVDGGTGIGETNLLVSSGNNMAVKYVDAIAKVGYVVKVFSGANVQARGTIQ